MNGLLVINKDENLTSRDVVNQISYLFDMKKVGHTGTLDPLATGVLVVCLGKATRLTPFITNCDKEYVAEVTLGLGTDTYDITGTVVARKNPLDITKEDIEIALQHFACSYLQEVPLYSAVKVKGKKLYHYARNNENVTLPKKEVTIKEIELISDIEIKDDTIIFTFKTLVSKGTYIRSLIKDIGDYLSVPACMSNLKRTKQGNFTIESSQNLEEIKSDSPLIPMLEALKDYLIIEVDEILKEKINNGCVLDNLYAEDVIVFTYQKELIAIYEIYQKDLAKIKPLVVFKEDNYD